MYFDILEKKPCSVRGTQLWIPSFVFPSDLFVAILWAQGLGLRSKSRLYFSRELRTGDACPNV